MLLRLSRAWLESRSSAPPVSLVTSRMAADLEAGANGITHASSEAMLCCYSVRGWQERSSPTVVLMAQPEVAEPRQSTGHSAWRRFWELMSEGLRILSRLSLDTYPGLEGIRNETSPRPGRMIRHAQSDLQTQLEDLLDCVWRQEKMWRLEDRIEGSLSNKHLKPRPTKKPRAPRRWW